MFSFLFSLTLFLNAAFLLPLSFLFSLTLFSRLSFLFSLTLFSCLSIDAVLILSGSLLEDRFRIDSVRFFTRGSNFLLILSDSLLEDRFLIDSLLILPDSLLEGEGRPDFDEGAAREPTGSGGVFLAPIF